MSRDLDQALRDLSLGGAGGGSVLVADFARWPAKIRVKIDVDRVLAKVGPKTAAEVRNRIKSGRGANGRSLPAPVDARPQAGRQTKKPGNGRPLNRTGGLIRSIKYNRRRRIITAMGLRSDLGPTLEGRQAGLLWVLIHLSKRKGNQIDPMGVDAQLGASIQRRLGPALQKELDRPGSGLVAELRRLKGK